MPKRKGTGLSGNGFRGPMTMNKTTLWFGILMAVCTILLLTIMFKHAGVPVSGEDFSELSPAATPLSPVGQTLQGGQPGQDLGVQFSAGIGGQQMQLIDTFMPTGLGGQSMRLIKQGGPYLGMSLSAVPPDVAAQCGLAVGVGAYVNTVVPGAPVQTVGIAPGDVILRLDNTNLTGPDTVGQVMSGKRPGDVLQAVVQRGTLRQCVLIVLENAPLGIDVGKLPTTPWLGADVQDVDAIMRIQLNLPDSKGVLVGYVAPNSPASLAGLAIGDLIQQVGTTRIRDVRQFQSIILKGQPGQVLPMSVMRANQILTTNVTLGLKPTTPPTVPYLSPADIVVDASWIGMDLSELTPKDVMNLGIGPGTRGMLVNDVEGPPASSSGIQTGDVITAVNGTPTPDLKSFTAATRQQAGAVLAVIRGNKHVFLTVPPPGFTAAGTKLNTGIDRKFRQVAATARGMVAVMVADKDVNAQVSTEANAQAVVLVDLTKRVFAIVETNTRAPLADLLQQNGVSALICADLSGQTKAALSAKGISAYSGVVGSVQDAVGQYEQQGLAPANGQ